MTIYYFVPAYIDGPTALKKQLDSLSSLVINEPQKNIVVSTDHQAAKFMIDQLCGFEQNRAKLTLPGDEY